MRFGFYDHRGLGRPYAAALVQAGHVIHDGPRGDILLIDNDAPLPPHVDLFAAHERAFLYPHGGGVTAGSAGIYPRHPKVRGRFVVGQGQIEVLAASGDSLPVGVTGWPWCDLVPFQQREPRRILYAPDHTDFYGWAADETKAYNAEAFARLLALPGREITVRTVLGTLAEHGLPERLPDGVHHEVAEPSIDPSAVDRHDLIVARRSTFASLAIARGRATVTYAQDGPERILDPISGSLIRQSPVVFAAANSLGRYQYDLFDTPDTGSLFERAALQEDVDWRTRFVGGRFDPVRFAHDFAAAVRTW